MENNKEIILEAINNYDTYHKKGNGKKDLLKLLVELAVDEHVTVHMEDIQKVLKVSRTTLFYYFDRLERDLFIERSLSRMTKYRFYKLNQEKLNFLVQLYNQKKSFGNLEKISKSTDE